MYSFTLKMLRCLLMTTSRRTSSLEEKRHLGKGEKENSRRRRRKTLGKEAEMGDRRQPFLGAHAGCPPALTPVLLGNHCSPSVWPRCPPGLSRPSSPGASLNARPCWISIVEELRHNPLSPLETPFLPSPSQVVSQRYTSGGSPDSLP